MIDTKQSSAKKKKNKLKIKAWCGDCFQFFESGPSAKICKDHLTKGKCNLIECKKSSSVNCVRKFPNTNSENRHTYCLNSEQVRDFDESLKIQSALGNKRGLEKCDSAEAVISGLSKNIGEEANNSQELVLNSQNDSEVSKLNNYSSASYLVRSSLKFQGLKTKNKTNPSKDHFLIHFPATSESRIPNMIENLDFDNISLKSVYINKPLNDTNDHSNLTNHPEQQTLIDKIDRDCNNLFDKLHINKSIRLIKEENLLTSANEIFYPFNDYPKRLETGVQDNGFSNSLLLLPKDSNYSKVSNFNTHDLTKHLEQAKARQFTNFEQVNSSNIFGLCDKIGNIDFFSDSIKSSNREKSLSQSIKIENSNFEEDLILDKMIKMSFESNHKKVEQDESRMAPRGSSLKKREKEKVEEKEEEKYKIRDVEPIESIFTILNKESSMLFSKHLLTKLKSALKKKGLVNALSLRLYKEKRSNWDQLIEDLKDVCSEVEGIACKLEQLLDIKEK